MDDRHRTREELLAELEALNKQLPELRGEIPMVPLQMLLAGGPNFVSVADATGALLYLNPSARNILDIGPDEPIDAIYFPDCMAPEFASSIVREVIPQMLASGEHRWSGEGALLSRTGRVTPALFSAMMHFSADGVPRFQTCIAHDLTEHKRAEQALRVSEARNRALLRAIPDMIFRVSEDATILDFEPAPDIPPAIPPDLFLGKRFTDVLPPEIAGEAIRLTRLALETETVQTMEYKLPTAGALRDFEARGVKCAADEVVWIAQDTTERKRAQDEVKRLSEGLKERVEQRTAELKAEINERKHVERALRESEARYRNYLARSPYGIFVLDADGNLVGVNPAAIEQTGYSRAQLLTMGIPDLMAPESTEAGFRDFMELKHSGAFYAEYCFMRSDGSRFWMSVNGSKLSEERWLAFTRDTTERRRAEQTRRQLDEERQKVARLESIGTLAGGIAHDFNNCLTGILGNMELARVLAASGATDGAQNALERAIAGCRQSQQLTQQLLTFAKGGVPIKKLFRLQEMLPECCSFALSGSNTRYDCAVDENLWPTLADPGQITQVVQNILLNADQAMPYGGTIEIQAENVSIQGDVGIPLEPGNYVKMTFSDHGPGIAPENLARVFEPYFTTKHDGSGLGLATTYSIVKKHDGYIKVDSEPGAGTTFAVYLPASDGDIEEPSVEPLLCQRRKGRILVMDDEELVGIMLSAALGEEGHQVVLASDGARALELFEESLAAGAPFELLILDLTIPGGMGGVATLAALREIDPGIKAIVASGYSTDPVLSDPATYGFDGVLAKPFRLKTLGQMVQRLLISATTEEKSKPA